VEAGDDTHRGIRQKQERPSDDPVPCHPAQGKTGPRNRNIAEVVQQIVPVRGFSVVRPPVQVKVGREREKVDSSTSLEIIAIRAVVLPRLERPEGKRVVGRMTTSTTQVMIEAGPVRGRGLP
jgi:hypothetical protein